MPRPGEDDWRAVRALNAYRWMLAVTAGALYLTETLDSVFHINRPALFAPACLAYLIICLPSTWAGYRQRPDLRAQVYMLAATDMAFIWTLVLASGGVGGGLAVLLVMPVAGAGMLLRPRGALLLAAIASLGLLATEGWRGFDVPGSAQWVPAGLLGALLFLAAGVANTLARRARSSAALAFARQAEVEDLTALNERIIQEMTPGLLVVDAQRRIRLHNPAAAALFDLDRHPSGERLAQVIPELGAALQAWQIAPGLATEVLDIGGRRIVPRFSPLGNGHGAAVLILAEDARGLDEAAQQIKLAALGRLTASIAHEIRNPLSAINHAGQLLDESPGLGAQDRRLLAIVHRHTRRIDGIIESVLGLSRRGRSLPARLNLGFWLGQALADYRHSRPKPPPIRLAPAPTDLDVHADRNQLTQILANLLANAEQHAHHPGREIQIVVSAGRNQDGGPWLEVADNGPGIPAAVAAQVMEPFFTTARDGTGLGLYLARELCAANGARLAVRSGADGSRFRVVFSRPQTPGSDRAGAAPAASA